EFGEGEQLPSERELMAFFNVGRPSVREALAALKRKGLVQINNNAITGTLLLLAGGTAEQVERATPVLMAMGNELVNTGGPGMG
ncbi:GntR family transcriptional regulator, partial [Salmonella enterica subsp. enterica serovar Kentucky]|nr:GntR family transcriptional regulator [Salmonella enterica subsp. enterica serovar Kentucky]